MTSAMNGWLPTLLQTGGLRIAVLPATAAMGILAAAISVQHVGPTAYGYVSLVAQLTLLLPFADFGIGAAVTRQVAQAKADPSAAPGARRLVVTSARLLAAIGTVGGAVSIVLGIAGTWADAFSAPSALADGVNITTSAVLAVFFFSLPLAVGQRILIGQDRARVVVLVGLLTPAMNLAFVSIASSAGLPAMSLALGTAIGAALTAFAFAALGMSARLGGIGLSGARGLAAGDLGTVLASAMPMLITVVGSAVVLQSGRVLLANTSAPDVLSEYSLAVQLYLPIYSVLYMSSTVLWPRFAVRLDKRLWVVANLTFLGIGVLASAGFGVFAPALVSIMSAGAITLSGATTASFCLLLMVQAIHSTQSMLLTSARGLWIQAACNTAAAGATIILTITYAEILDAATPAFSAAASMLLLAVLPCFVISWMLVRAASKCKEGMP